MRLETLMVALIMVGKRRRPVDASIVRDIASSIERQGLLQPIGVQALDDAESYRLVYGAHRLAAIQVLGWDTIDAYVLPDAWSDDECLLAELQENCARNDLTGVQRKAYAAEAGRLLSKMPEVSNGQNLTESWLVELGQKINRTRQTLHNWWQAFREETGVSCTPGQATDANKQQFFDWLEAQNTQAEADKARRLEDERAHKQAVELEDACAYLAGLALEYGADTIWQACIVPVFPGYCSPQDEPHA